MNYCKSTVTNMTMKNFELIPTKCISLERYRYKVQTWQ